MTYDHAAALRNGTDWATGWRRRQLAKHAKAESRPGVHYEQPPIHGQPERGSFRIPRDVFAALGRGDLKAGGAVAHAMFGIEPDGDPTLVEAEMVRHVGHGDINAGRRVLEKFIAQVRLAVQPRIEQPDGHSPDRIITR